MKSINVFHRIHENEKTENQKLRAISLENNGTRLNFSLMKIGWVQNMTYRGCHEIARLNIPGYFVMCLFE